MSSTEKPVYIGKYVYIKPRQITVMNAYDVPKRFGSLAFQNNKKNLADNKHKGELSKKSQRKLATVVDWLIVSAKQKYVFDKRTQKHFAFKVNFITLTLPDTETPITEKELKKNLLHPWIVYMRKYGYMRNYVWKIEFQENGKLHVHFTTDTFIHYDKIRDSWNRLLYNNGYLSKWFAEHGNYQPNSTDVHAVSKIKNLGGYIAKYMAKTSTYTHTATSRLWGCNYELSRALKTNVHIFPPDEERSLRPLMSNDVGYKPLIRESGILNQISIYGEVFWLHPHQWSKMATSLIGTAYNYARSDIRNLAPNPPPEYMVVESKVKDIPIIKPKVTQGVLGLSSV